MSTPADPYAGRNDLTTQGETWVTAPLDTLFAPPKCIWCDVGGNLTIEGLDGVALTFVVAAGHTDLRPRKIISATTTATGIKLITS